MKQFAITISLILAGIVTSGQNLDDFDFSTDSTLEVVTWNIETFPKNGLATVDYVEDIITAIDADILAFQEITDTYLFENAVSGLDGYEAYFPEENHMGLAYAWKTGTVDITEIYRIYPGDNYSRPFPRRPLVMEFSYKGTPLIVVNNHFKCCGDNVIEPEDPWDEETRRLDASELIKTYIDENWPEKHVMVVGDLNDILTDDVEDNVFRIYFDDLDNYRFADWDIANGSSSHWSYPSWPSHLDHILITNELFDEMDEGIAATQTLEIDDYLEGGWNEYENNVSDHRPVAVRFQPDEGVGISPISDSQTKLTIAPNPAKKQVTIQSPEHTSEATVIIYNSQGVKIVKRKIKNGVLHWNTTDIAPGIYIVKFISENRTIASGKVIVKP